MDCSVGTIVWVRRRNGSWWPGRILGQHELSASHLMSPRSGTPVKLLGREDASVDWYNLEKSKRVKAFRCGEFDACIERAEASQGVPIKKREKYARREDAILHALELEKEQLEKQQCKFRTNSSNLSYKHSGALKKELDSHSALELHLINVECMDHDKSVNNNPQSHLNRNGKPTHWEDDNSETMPRMRGLQDFGLCIAPAKRRASCSPVFDRAKHSLIDNHVDDFPYSGNGMGSVNSHGCVKSSSAVKRKRSNGGLVEEYLIKRHDRRRPLIQVLKSSAQLPAMQSLQTNCESSSILAEEEKEHIGAKCRAKRSRCIYLPSDSNDCLDETGYSFEQMHMLPTQFVCSNGLHQLGSFTGEETSSGLIRDEGTSSSEGGSVCADMEEETTELQDDKLLGSKNSIRYARNDASTLEDHKTLGKMSNEYEAFLSDCKALILSNDEAAGTADVGVSQWHMKGKRNIRNLTKRTMEVLDGKNSVNVSDNCNGSSNEFVYEKKQSVYKKHKERISGQDFYHKDELNYACPDDFFDKDFDNKLVGFGKQRYPLMLKSAFRNPAVAGITYSDEDSQEMFSSRWEADELLHLDQKTYWGESGDFLDPLFLRPLNVEMRSSLVDVDLKVQASYHGERVPLVSLMSRLNGKAIVGHPVHIDILKDGSTDFLLPKNGVWVDSIGVEEHATAPPVWRTGRRTAMQRVPRTDLAPSPLEADEPELDLGSDVKPLFREPYASPLQVGSVKKSFHHCQSTTGKSHRKLPKKGSLSNQKTRTLSSIVTDHKRAGVSASAKDRRKGSGILGGLIKPGGTVPLVACVPVKVVFSRILEAVGRPSSAGTAHWGILTGSAERNPS